MIWRHLLWLVIITLEIIPYLQYKPYHFYWLGIRAHYSLTCTGKLFNRMNFTQHIGKYSGLTDVEVHFENSFLYLLIHSLIRKAALLSANENILALLYP